MGVREAACLDGKKSLLEPLGDLVVVLFLHPSHGSLDELPKRVDIHIRQTLDIQARLARRVGAEVGHQFRVSIEARHDIQRQISLARRKPGQRPYSLPTRSVLVPVRPKADDTCPPHSGLLTRDRRHERKNRFAVGAPIFVSDGGDEFRHTRRRLFRL